MKKEKKERARELRRLGYSVKEICREIGGAKSSVSIWVRDIELNEEQIQALKHRNPVYHGQHLGSKVIAEKHRRLREQYQQEGRLKAREQNLLHIAGCMLYWAEGTKAHNQVELANSDPDMLKVFLNFLREQLDVEDSAIRLRVSCYLGNGLSAEEIENWWLTQLNLPASSLDKTIINIQPRLSSQMRGRKLRYGMCHLRVYSTQALQHIYGAIQEYIGIDKPEWLR